VADGPEMTDADAVAIDMVEFVVVAFGTLCTPVGIADDGSSAVALLTGDELGAGLYTVVYMVTIDSGTSDEDEDLDGTTEGVEMMAADEDDTVGTGTTAATPANKSVWAPSMNP
jgi:hypothetical protein